MRYDLPDPARRKAGPWTAELRRHAWWLIPLLVLDLLLVAWLVVRRGRGTPDAPAPGPTATEAEPAAPVAPAAPALSSMVLPSPQTRLLDGDLTVFMHTGTGNHEAGTFGSVRTQSSSRGLAARFHEGVDIAPVQRDARGRPLDDVFAAATGRVGYVNRHAGNSDYGQFVVLLHDDPAGPVYTLYAHLAAVTPGLAEGAPVAAGAVLGRMGNTALDPIPMERAHLHFEIGVLLNDRFADWARRNKQNAPGGRFNGQNLAGLDPVAVLTRHRDTPGFTFAEAVAHEPPAFELAVRATRRPDYFARHAALWTGEPFRPGVIVLAVSESGAPLSGRLATAEEAARPGRESAAVLAVHEDVLGRNGRAHVVRGRSGWTLGSNGRTWLSILLH